MNETYKKLVDLYANHELPEQVEREMEAAASMDAELSSDMMSLRATVDSLQELPEPEFTLESYQRILMKIYSKGVDMQTRQPDPAYLQYHLPIQG